MIKWSFLLGCYFGCLFNSNAQLQFGATGSWRAHFSNQSIQQIIKGTHLYLAGKNQIIQIDDKNEISYLNTTSGLHNIGINKIGWHPVENQLVVVYNNSSVDIVSGSQVYLINDIEKTTLYNDKTINDLYINNNKAYLSCNFGIVVIDLLNREIKETLFPGNTRQVVKVLKTLLYQNKIIALTNNGIWSATLGQNNKWEIYDSKTNVALQNMFLFKNQLYFNNEKYIFQDQSAIASYQVNVGNIKAITVDEEQVYALTSNEKKSSLILLDKNKSNTVLIDTGTLINPIGLLKEKNNIWIADLDKGLYLKSEPSRWVSLGGPFNKFNGAIDVAKNQLLMGYGKDKVGISNYSALGWKNYSKLLNLELSNIEGVSIDPNDASWWFGMGSNLVHYDPNKNTIEQSTPNTNTGVIKSIQQNKEGNRTILKDRFGLVMNENEKWLSYPIPSIFSNTNLKDLLIGKDKLNWIIGPSNQGILLFQIKNNQAKWKQLTTGKNAGNLPSLEVTAIAQDKDGHVWAGTSNGIGIYQCTDIEEACDAYLPIVSSNGFNGYLFQKETINCISVDGANRKWIGTNNGAWLMSKDGTVVIEHFTTENSPLPSNKIVSIRVEPSEGDVFFFTDNEIVSFKSNATEGAATQEKVKIFPNPVSPNYEGQIVIRNLVANAIVKITDINGKLISQVRALGGQANWNGRDQNQQKVASGIYLIFVRDEAGNEKTVGKIMITAGY